MSTQAIKLLVPGVVLFHGLGFLGAVAALAFVAAGHPGGGWVAARSWALPALTPSEARAMATGFWVISAAGFVVAALSGWGILVPVTAWRPLAVTFALISALGIILFFGTWPMFNTLAALGVNLAILYTQLWMHWPPRGILGH